ncbi:MAG: hypothetical protein FWG66_01335 [Spirochaetes bacterium]|nr:hypothetical protein [Spirochaetota bacterium]
MKILSRVIVLLIAGFIVSVGYNIFSIHNRVAVIDNHLEIAFEAARRINPSILGLIGGTLRGDPLAALGGEENMFREMNNVLFDWYAPIQMPLILNFSKEIGWFILREELSNSFQF